MNEPLSPRCAKCGAGNIAGLINGLRVVRPRVACTVSTFAEPEVRCFACCKETRGMFKLSRQTLSDFYARKT